MPLYGYPEMGRFGLGHSLTAWGRCAVWCNLNSARMLAPRWLRLRVGPYLRGERDKREYYKLFNNKGMIRGLQRDLILLRAKTVLSKDGYFKENIYDATVLESLRSRSGSTVVTFTNARRDNEKKHFKEIYGYSTLLRRKLEAMVRATHLPRDVQTDSIAVHVRMGDFFIPKNEVDLLKNSVRLPLPWFIRTLEKIRTEVGRNVPAVVYSDGTDDELAELLSCSDVSRAPRRQSVTDLLSIAKAPLLIASGSGFSLWAGFLGQIPSIHFPGRKIVPILDDPSMELELAANAPLPAGFLEKTRLLSASC